MLLEAFLVQNSVISFFQFGINWGIRIASNVGAVLIGENNVKIDDFWVLGMSYQVIPGHGNPQKRRTIFIRYLFKYCSLNFQKFHQVFKNTS